MQLAKNFSLFELTNSEVAIRCNIDNTPDNQIILNLTSLANKILQPIRDYYNKPVIINSGYRSPVLNKKIGGSNTSDHCKGMAADIVINGLDNYALACFIRDNLKFKQVILEFYNKVNNSGWVHVSYDSNDLKCQQLSAIKTKGKTIYKNGLII